VRILLALQGQWGRRIADHLQESAPPEWQIAVWQGPAALPLIVDDPEEFLPPSLEQAELLVVLPESAGLTDLASDLALRCHAQAVLIGIDKRPWAPPGLVRQVRRRLERVGVASAAPIPFCSLAPSPRQHPLIRTFAEHFGRPELRCIVRQRAEDGVSSGANGGYIEACHIVRETPCGNTRYIVQHLPGTPRDRAVEQAGLLHHYYPCWGGMETDPVQSASGPSATGRKQRAPQRTDRGPADHSPLHVAATMAQKSVARALENTEPNGETE
jgi:hypothetical protein